MGSEGRDAGCLWLYKESKQSGASTWSSEDHDVYCKCSVAHDMGFSICLEMEKERDVQAASLATPITTESGQVSQACAWLSKAIAAV